MITLTDFDGNFSLNCPTKECLIYSFAEIGGKSNVWIQIIPAGAETELSESQALTFNIPENKTKKCDPLFFSFSEC